MVDSIKVYCKTKESFGWPDDPQEELPSTPGVGPTTAGPFESEITSLVSPATIMDK